MLFSALVASAFRMGQGANSSTQTTSDDGSNSKAGWILLGAAAVLAAGSIGYNVYNSGQGEPEVEAITDGEPTLEDLQVAAENSSDDAGPWADLAFAYFQRGEFAEAADAYRRAVDIDDDEAVLWSALGESLVYASERDPLPAEALAAFDRAAQLDPGDPRARYFQAVKLDLEEDHEGAISAWLALLSDTPPGAPWEADLVRTIQQVGAINNIEVEDRLATVIGARTPEVALPGSGSVAGDAAAPDVRGPSAQQVADASRMTPGEQEQMVAGMVASLEQRLEDDPSNLNGWVMLMRSRMTLDEPAKAREALQKAVAANPDNAEELRRQAAQLGIQ